MLHVSGGQISRPSVHFFYFLEEVTRKLKWREWSTEVPAAMAERGAVAYVPDRFHRLPPGLQQHLLENYQPYDDSIWFWGRSLDGAGGGVRERVVVPRAGNYFVWPTTALQAGRLLIDGRVVSTPVFALEAGERNITYEGEAAELVLMWLPADGQVFRPQRELQPTINASGAR